jgi:tripartite-type tricarboxylate transporter receptor subunit TctC
VPGVPAISEFYPQFEAQSWVGILAPAAAPRGVIQRLNAEVNRILAAADVRAHFAQLGFEIVGGTPAQFGVWLRDESAKWGKVIRAQRITAE